MADFLDMQTWIQLFGIAAVFKFIYDLLIGVWRHFLRPGIDVLELGKWAVVTGGTDGIGLAIAEELCARGMSVIIIARNADRLATARKSCIEKATGGAKCETLQVDYSDFNQAKQEEFKKFIADKQVGLLVNNVGISYPFCQYFHELDDERVEQLITLNITSTTLMTRLVLPGMLEAKRGAIINISSAAGRQCAPLLSQYSAAKGYVDKFSISLAAELQSKGISVQSQSPFWVTTKLAKVRNPSLVCPTPETYAKCALKSIGYEWNVSPYWVHDAMMYAFIRLPFAVQGMICNNMHHQIRKKGFAKLAKAKQES